jgi:homoserine kinase
MTSSRQSSFEVRVPASTANMGAGFDCLGLALEMYLSVRATVLAKPEGRARVRGRGVRGTSELPSDPDQNLIARAMRLTAEREGFSLPRVRIAVQNQIPVAGGLGSSAAATVAGIALGFAVTGRAISKDAALRYATELAQGDSLDRGDAEREAGNEKIALRAARQRAPCRRRF